MLVVEKNISSLSDKILIQKYQESGDQALIGELYRRYHHLVFGTCMKFLQDRDQASDMVVDIFEKLFNKLAHTEVDNFDSWIYSLAKNECISWHRKERSKRNTEENWRENEKKSEIFMENEALLRLCEEEFQETEPEDEEEELVRQALKQLPKPQRVCLQLFFYKEMSYQQIAEQTKFSLLQVKSYLQNGKRNLKKLLEAEML